MIKEIDIKSVCFGILCNFTPICGEKRAKEASNLVSELYAENQKLISRAEVAEARCETLEKMAREYQDVIVPGYRERAEKAERERDEAVEVICARCSVLPCRENECYWYRGQKEE